jgi:hypothetical protein
MRDEAADDVALTVVVLVDVFVRVARRADVMRLHQSILTSASAGSSDL